MNDLEILHLSETDRQRWNNFVAHSSHFALMQSYGWGEVKEALGWKAIRIAVARQGQIIAGAQVLLRSLLGLAGFAYIPRGPLLDWQDSSAATVLLNEIHRVARQHNALFLRIEPPLLHSAEAHESLQRYGFQAAAQTNQPRSTLILNLEPDLETLFKNLPKRTRYHINSCQRKGVKVYQGGAADLPVFYELLRTTAERGGFTVRSAEYYEQEFAGLAQHNQTVLFLADYAGEPIAAEMPFVFGPHGAAFHGASSNEHRHLPVSDLLTWAGVQWAKEQGCQSYDLWGIPDEAGELAAAGQPIPKDKQGGLWGVYYFKKGFGGDIIYYVGAYDYVYVRPAYIWATRMQSWLEARGNLSRLMDKR